MSEIVRGSEYQRSVEQSALFGGTDVGYTTGVIRGIDRTLARTGLGVYEVVTFPLPSYTPTWTNYLSPKPQYPDAYQPRKVSDPIFDTDHYNGYSGGDVAPMLPGSRFTVFDN
jgi:putative exosortase-associated protein (TIGR04073 family)